MSFIEDMAKTTTQLIDTLVLEHTSDELISILCDADDAYSNGEEPPITDEQYDILRREVELSIPHHVYFTGVGSAVRGGKIKLPHKMGSLNQKFENETIRWVTDNDLIGAEFVITDKLDGVSAMAIYDCDGSFQIAYSRGNGVEGADISRHLKHIIPKTIRVNKSTAIRGEVIISKHNFVNCIQPKLMTSAGKPYKNGRNCIAGILNSELIPEWVYQHIDFIAYDLVES